MADGIQGPKLLKISPQRQMTLTRAIRPAMGQPSHTLADFVKPNLVLKPAEAMTLAEPERRYARHGITAEILFGCTGADRLFGEGSDDVLVGGAGNDTLSGDGGSDLAHFGEAAGPVRVDLALGRATGADDVDQLHSIERVAAPASRTRWSAAQTASR